MSVFEPVYANRNPHVVTLKNNSGEYKPEPVSYQWKYRKTDNNYYDSTPGESNSKEDISITVKDSSFPEILSDFKPDNIKWSISQNDKLVFESDGMQNNSFSLSDGIYQCTLELEWLKNKNSDFYGKAKYDFNIKVDNPPEIWISSLQTYPGVIGDHC